MERKRGVVADKKVTIYDVAKHCGVSVATVSRIVNNADYPISSELRARVQASVRELKYKPNMLGRYLKSNRTNEVGVIIPNISNFYYPGLISGINDSLIHSGYNVLLCNSYRNPEYEKKQFLSLLQKQVKGIVISTISDDTSWLEEVPTDGVTVVAIEQPLHVPTHRVCFNYYGGGYMAARYLIDMGHRDIAFISAPLTYASRRQRLDGFTAGLKESGIDLGQNYLRISDYERDDENAYEFNIGRRLADKLMQLDAPPTAIFCINDMMAVGVIRALQSQGIRVPQDVSVLGFDNMAISEIITPALTTIDQCTREMGARAIELLHKSFEDPTAAVETVHFKPKLVERESVARRL